MPPRMPYSGQRKAHSDVVGPGWTSGTRRELSEPPGCLLSWPYDRQIDHYRRLLRGAHLSPASASAAHLCATQHSAASADLQCSPGVSQAGDTGPYSRDSEIDRKSVV